MPNNRLPSSAFALTLLCAAALSACGGGGGDASTADATSVVDSATATNDAANATAMASDAGAALDVGVQTAQAIVVAQAGLSAAHGEQAILAVEPNAVVNVPVTCAGGGSATLTINGGTPASVVNGKLDTGEVYSAVFTNCKGTSGAVAVSGSLTMTVVSASTTTTASATETDLALTLVASGLVVALPGGSATLDGSAAQTSSTVSSTVGASTTTTTSSRFTSPGITLVTQRNTRGSRFTLSAVDITRASSALNGVLQASSFTGTHTLAATLASGAFSYTVATQGSVGYSATGVPLTGAFSITLPKTLIGVAIANASATITVDDGKDGTIDRTVVVPIGTLQAAAG